MAGEAPPGERPLTSWKEIAAVFGRDVRTVQRWEKDELLPVYRHVHQSRPSVYAYESELQAWWQRRNDHLPNGRAPSRRIVTIVKRVAPAVAALLALAAIGVVATSRLRRPADDAADAGAIASLGLPADAGEAPRVLTGDIDGDGSADLVVGVPAAGAIYVLPARERPDHGWLPDVARVQIKTTDHGMLVPASLGDVNGDGLADLLLSTFLYEPDSFHATGPSHLVFGRRDWPAQIVLPDAADVTLTMSGSVDTRLGGCAATGPLDLDADGLAEVVLGANDFSPPGRPSAGGTFILFGRREWPTTVRVEADADIQVHGSRTGEALGSSCAVGDLDGDGRRDLILGASESTLWNHLGGRGRVYVLAGRPRWPRVVEADEDARWRIDGIEPQTGAPLIFTADLNGDRRHELVANWVGPADAERPTGRLTVWRGGAERVGRAHAADRADLVIDWSGRENPGLALAAADLDRDGCDDLLYARPSEGDVCVLYGHPDRLLASRPHGFEGTPVARVGGRPEWWLRAADLNGDALLEAALVVGAARPDRASQVLVLELYRRFDIDIRPDRVPNVLQWPGVLVARTATTTADGESVNEDTIRLAGAPPVEIVRATDADDDPRLQLIFDTARMDIDASTTRVALVARTRSGRLAGGADEVMVIPTESAPGGTASRSAGSWPQ